MENRTAGRRAGGVAVVLDITERRQADLIENAGRTSGFEEVFENAPIGTGLLDTDGRWLLVNRALCDITGYTAEELIGKRFEGIVHPDDVFNDAEQRSSLLQGQCAAYQVEKRYFDAAGETVAAILSVSLVRDPDGSPLHYIAQLQDVSGRRRLEEHQRQLADHDPLTGLRDRRLFEHDLRLQVRARSRRYGEIAGLMVIELDGLRALSARHGHAVGEETIRAVGRALARRLRETDLVGRLATDEFAVLLPHIDREGISVVADGIGRVPSACSACRRQRPAPARHDRLHPDRRALRERRAGTRAGCERGPGSQALRTSTDPATEARPHRARRSAQYAHGMNPGERLAVIDLGSNSFRLVVFTAGEGWWKRTDEIHEPVRIGEGMLSTGRLGSEPIGRALATLDVFSHFCRASNLHEDSVDAVATSAIRDASNAKEFLEQARERSGMPIRVLSREQEANYGYLAAANSARSRTAASLISAADRCSSCE